ncbi:exodeoxyribonuclease V subunit alpha [Buchnera aphidicola (Periphyllus koelreuteriae)]|uniref:exodeoxyribonuclease V subunit alpha n=1 Tax=Buchnera aphidicola TaxID=9 RepID=UPI0031B8635F
MLNIMKKLVKKKILKKIDFYFAKNISKKNESLILIISAYLSLKYRKGYTFISLKNILKKKFFTKKILNKINHIKSLENIKKELLKNNFIKKNNFPIILNKNILYLNKIWNIEKKIYKFLNYKYKLKKYNFCKLNKIIKTNLFKKLNFEKKNAIISCLLNKFTFILGGPGTGKTHIISKIIFLFLKISKKKKIIISSTTGKSSNIILESIKKNKLLNKNQNKIKQYIPNKSYTLHKLFKINNNINNFFFKQKKINVDLLIIDESSMIDLFIFNKIIDLTYKKTQIIFLGDKNQLPSINVGSILNDIFIYFKKNKHHKLYLKFKENIIKNKLNKNFYKNKSLKNKICYLKKNYRFNKNSDIYKFSQMIKKFKKNKEKKIFNNKLNNIKFYILKKKISYIKIMKKIFLFYKNYWNIIIKKKSIKKIFKLFNKIRILCVLKKGNYGVKGINKIFKYFIKKNNLTYFKKYDKKLWYIGKPIIIKKNLYQIKLFNGNIGITLLDKDKKMKVFFVMPDQSIKIIPINLIRNYQTTWAITIHKSQGSEFNKIILIMPLKKNRIMSREIIYTAITRAKKKILIYSKKNIFLKSIQKTIVKKSKLLKKK